MYFPGNANAGGQCFAQGYTFTTTPNAVCSTTANTNNRRIATLLNPVEGKKLANIGSWDDGGTRSYNALLLNTQKRLSKGFSMTANYTWSHCLGTPIGSGTLLQSSAGNGVYLTPTRKGDRGNCTAPAADVRHLVNGTGIVSLPKFSSTWMNALASNWRLSGILTAASGSAFTVVSGTDRALNGKNAIFKLQETQTVEFRAEGTNILNHANFGLPSGNLNSAQFGRIQSASPGRVMQFGLKYLF